LDLDAVIESAPEGAAVFAVFAKQGPPYLAKTTMLRRRLRRLFSPNARLLSLRNVAERIDYVPTASRLEASLTHYEWAKRCFPDDWQRRVRLRMPAWVKLILSNEFPRTQVTSRLAASDAKFFGPFRTRAAAEAFEAGMLDLFQVRRCPEDLAPSPEHPGCIYGEMNLCLRPCQQAVSRQEYLGEVSRLAAFLETGGATLLDAASAARDRASEAMEFEHAERQHRRVEKIQEVRKLREDLASELGALHGIAVLPSTDPATARLQMIREGWWQPAIPFSLTGAGQSMDARLRDVIAGAAPYRGPVQERQEHCAILSQWFHSSFGLASGDGAWIACPSMEEIPYRRLVRAVSSVSQSLASRPVPPAAT
jgi:excinuclease UvrABC nuclease subunit